MKAHLEALDAAQRDVLERMAPSVGERGFYLGGGTAIALHLGHRKSVDLDWFTNERIEDPLRLAGELLDDGLALQDLRTERGTVHGALDGVRVSLIEYRYPLLEPAVLPDGVRAPIGSLVDLAAMKLAAMAQRGTRRDFIDLHALAVNFRPLPALLEAYRRKYGASDTVHLLYALAYFDDADREPMPTLLRPLDWEAVKTDLRGWIKQL